MFYCESLLFQPELHTLSRGWDPWGSQKGEHFARIGIGPGSLLLCARPAGWLLKSALILARAWPRFLFLIMGSMVLEPYSVSEVIEDLDTLFVL